MYCYGGGTRVFRGVFYSECALFGDFSLRTYLDPPGTNDWSHVQVLQTGVPLHRVEDECLLLHDPLQLPLLLLPRPEPLLDLLDGVEHVHQTGRRADSVRGASSVRPAGRRKEVQCFLTWFGK